MIGLVIAQLKNAPQTAQLFGGNVAGAAEYERAVQDQVWLPAPAAYVIPLEDEAGPNEQENGVYQIVRMRVGVIVALDNTPDRRGQSAVATVDNVRPVLFKALISWRPNSSLDNPDQPASPVNPLLDHDLPPGFVYEGGFLRGWDRARLFFELDFGVDVAIGPEDGWRPKGAPLSEIDVTITGGLSGSLATFNAKPKQS
jgi:hypothetical protein